MCEMKKILNQDVANLRLWRGGFEPDFKSMYLSDEQRGEHF